MNDLFGVLILMIISFGAGMLAECIACLFSYKVLKKKQHDCKHEHWVTTYYTTEKVYNSDLSSCTWKRQFECINCGLKKFKEEKGE